jgi:hypothetical protein
MFQIEVGVSLDHFSAAERIDNAKYVQGLLADKRFVRILMNAAERLVNEWSHAPTPQKREEVRSTLDGLQRLLRELSLEEDRGVEAAQAVRATAATVDGTGETRGVPTTETPEAEATREAFEARQALYDQQAGGAAVSDQPEAPKA